MKKLENTSKGQLELVERFELYEVGMTDSKYVSTEETALALGVGVSTVKRWADSGKLPIHRTAGGHRKVLRNELLRLIQNGVIPCKDASVLLRETPDCNSTEEIRQTLQHRLQQGNEIAVRSLIHGLIDNGMSIASFADTILSPVMRSIGHEWEVETIDVFHEHRATQIVSSALQELKRDISLVSETAPLALGGGIENDLYTLANLLIELILLQQGWRVVNLGPHTPLSSFELALQELRPRLLWLSISHFVDDKAFIRDYPKLYRCAEQNNIAVALGGQALTDDIRSQLPYTTFGDGLRHLTAFVRSLNP